MTFTASLADIVAKDRSGLLSKHPAWFRVALEDVARVQNGFAFPSSAFSRGRGIPLLRIRDLLTGTTQTRYDGDYDADYLVKPGQIVIGMDGDFNCVRWPGPRALLNQRVCRVIPNPHYYDESFLVYVLQGYLDAINEATPSQTVKHLSSRTVAEIPLPLPPLSEQQRIAAKLDELSSRLDAAEAALCSVQQQLKRYRQSVLKAAFAGQSAGSRSTRSQVPLAELGVVSGGITKNQRRKGLPLRVPYLRVANVQMGCVDLDELETIGVTEHEMSRTLLRKDDLLVVEGNGSRHQIGRVALWPGGEEPCVHQNHVIKVRLTKGIEPLYVMYWLLSPEGRRQVELVASSTSGLYTLSLSKVRALTVPVVPQDTQLNTVKWIEQAFSVTEAVDAAIAGAVTQAGALRRSIVKRALEGHLMPQLSDDEPAEKLLERIRQERENQGHIRRTNRSTRRKKIQQ